MPRVLLITYEFPPMGGVGVQRPLQFAKQLPKAGWDVTVLTVADPPSTMRDESLLSELGEGSRVRRVWSPEPTRAIQLLRRLRRRRATESQHAAPAPAGAGYSRMPSWVIKAVQALFIPDEKRLWRGPARREALKAVAEEGIRAVISSGPPHTAHLIADDVARTAALPWIVDLRDPWVGNYFFTPPTPIHAALQRRWERRVVTRADHVLVVSEPMAADLRRRHPGLPAERFIAIPNGFDPDELPSNPVPAGDALDVVYLGAFQGEIAPDAFLAGVRAAIDDGLVPEAGVRFTVIGPSSDIAAQAAGRAGVARIVESHGFLGHREALELAARAHVALLILPPGEKSRPILTGKLLEYLGLGKTVLALVPEGAAAELVREAGAGPVVAPDDVDGIANALGALHAAHAAGELPVPDPVVTARFDRRAQMQRVAVLLGEAAGGEAT